MPGAGSGPAKPGARQELSDQRTQLRSFIESWCVRQEVLLEAACREVPSSFVCNGTEEASSSFCCNGTDEASSSFFRNGTECPVGPPFAIEKHNGESKVFIPRSTLSIEHVVAPTLDREFDDDSPGLTKTSQTKSRASLEEIQETAQSQKVLKDLNEEVLGTSYQYRRSKFAVVNASQAIVSHRIFAWGIMFVILLNTISIAWSADAEARVQGASKGVIFVASEAVFLFIYIVEISLKIIGQGCSFWTGEERLWNAFDFAMVLSALKDHAEMLWEIEILGLKMSYLRVLRLGRELKLLRFIRMMRSFRELRLVIDSVMGSIKAMFWCALLSWCVAFMFGLFFLQGATDFLVDFPDHPRAEAMRRYFGTLPYSMLTLFMAATGGADWETFADLLATIGIHFHILFLLYIAVSIYVLANCITSLFVDSVLQYSSRDDHAIIDEQIAKRELYTSQIVALFEHMDENNDGRVSKEEFMRHLSDPRIAAFAASLEIETENLERFFDVLSSHGTHHIDLETFVVGCIKARGTARSLDVLQLQLVQKRILRNQAAHDILAEQTLVKLEHAMSHLVRIVGDSAASSTIVADGPTITARSGRGRWII